MILEESVLVAEPFDDVLPKVKALLAEEGFGTLTEIDVQATLRAKLGKEMARYVIIGACNPALASQALDAEPQIGALLPCNIVVREAQGGVLVEAMDPGVMAKLVDREPIHKVSDEARRLIGDALSRLSSGS